VVSGVLSLVVWGLWQFLSGGELASKGHSILIMFDDTSMYEVDGDPHQKFVARYLIAESSTNQLKPKTQCDIKPLTSCVVYSFP